MEGSVLSFLKAEWKVSDTSSAHWASSFFLSNQNFDWSQMEIKYCTNVLINPSNLNDIYSD